MRIGVDATCWSNERGYGRFAREIFAAMAALAPEHGFVCFADDLSMQRYSPSFPNVRLVPVSLHAAASEAASAAGHRSLRDVLAMTRAVAREELDVFFSPSVYTYFPLPPRLRTVVTIHDAIAERFPELTLPRARARVFWWAKVKVALMQSRRVLTVSEYAARDVERVHGVPRDRIDIAVEAPSAGFKPRDEATVLAAAKSVGLHEGQRWFVYVGGFNPHKNVPSIIRAHAAVVAKAASNPPHLLLVGTVDSDVFHGELPVIRAAIDAARTNSLVHWTGFLPDERLSALHSGAIALVLPSSAEGFGLPAVEAAACGLPVIATNESPLPDLLSESGIFVTPCDDKELELAMLTLLSDSAMWSRMSVSALRQSSELSWTRAARAALASLTAATA